MSELDLKTCPFRGGPDCFLFVSHGEFFEHIEWAGAVCLFTLDAHFICWGERGQISC